MSDGLPRLEFDLVAELDLKHPSLFLSPATRAADDVVVDLEYCEVGGDDSRAFFSARGDDVSRFESALRSDATVVGPARLASSGRPSMYRAAVAPDALSPFLPLRGLELFVRGVRGADGVWSVQLQFADRETLIAVREACAEADVSMSVRRLTSAEAGATPGLPWLTEDQAVLLELAYESGYFEIPRGASQNELADRLGVSSSAISHQLRRATASLVAATLYEGSP